MRCTGHTAAAGTLEVGATVKFDLNLGPALRRSLSMRMLQDGAVWQRAGRRLSQGGHSLAPATRVVMPGSGSSTPTCGSAPRSAAQAAACLPAPLPPDDDLLSWALGSRSLFHLLACSEEGWKEIKAGGTFAPPLTTLRVPVEGADMPTAYRVESLRTALGFAGPPPGKSAAGTPQQAERPSTLASDVATSWLQGFCLNGLYQDLPASCSSRPVHSLLASVAPASPPPPGWYGQCDAILSQAAEQAVQVGALNASQLEQAWACASMIRGSSTVAVTARLNATWQLPAGMTTLSIATCELAGTLGTLPASQHFEAVDEVPGRRLQSGSVPWQAAAPAYPPLQPLAGLTVTLGIASAPRAGSSLPFLSQALHPLFMARCFLLPVLLVCLGGLLGVGACFARKHSFATGMTLPLLITAAFLPYVVSMAITLGSAVNVGWGGDDAAGASLKLAHEAWGAFRELSLAFLHLLVLALAQGFGSHSFSCIPTLLPTIRQHMGVAAALRWALWRGRASFWAVLYGALAITSVVVAPRWLTGQLVDGQGIALEPLLFNEQAPLALHATWPTLPWNASWGPAVLGAQHAGLLCTAPSGPPALGPCNGSSQYEPVAAGSVHPAVPVARDPAGGNALTHLASAHVNDEDFHLFWHWAAGACRTPDLSRPLMFSLLNMTLFPAAAATTFVVLAVSTYIALSSRIDKLHAEVSGVVERMRAAAVRRGGGAGRQGTIPTTRHIAPWLPAHHMGQALTTLRIAYTLFFVCLTSSWMLYWSVDVSFMYPAVPQIITDALVVAMALVMAHTLRPRAIPLPPAVVRLIKRRVQGPGIPTPPAPSAPAPVTRPNTVTAPHLSTCKRELTAQPLGVWHSLVLPHALLQRAGEGDLLPGGQGGVAPSPTLRLPRFAPSSSQAPATADSEQSMLPPQVDIDDCQVSDRGTGAPTLQALGPCAPGAALGWHAWTLVPGLVQESQAPVFSNAVPPPHAALAVQALVQGRFHDSAEVLSDEASAAAFLHALRGGAAANPAWHSPDLLKVTWYAALQLPGAEGKGLSTGAPPLALAQGTSAVASTAVEALVQRQGGGRLAFQGPFLGQDPLTIAVWPTVGEAGITAEQHRQQLLALRTILSWLLDVRRMEGAGVASGAQVMPLPQTLQDDVADGGSVATGPSLSARAVHAEQDTAFVAHRT